MARELGPDSLRALAKNQRFRSGTGLFLSAGTTQKETLCPSNCTTFQIGVIRLGSGTFPACVELDERAQSESPSLSPEISSLRGDLHALLMDALRQAHIPFADRMEAASIAFDIAQGHRSVA